MKSTLLSRRDLDFLLFEWLRVDELTKRERFAEHSEETFAGVLDLCEQLATRYFAPHNKKSDANEPSFDGKTVTIIPEVKEALDAFARADLIAMGMDTELGGAQLPMAVAGAGLAWFHAANTSTAAYVLLTQANASLLASLRYRRADRCVPETDARRPIFGNDVPVGAAGRIVARRHRHPQPNRATQARSPARTACSDRKCGSPVANTSSPTTSCTWCSRRSPAVRRARKASRCSSCRNSSSPPTARIIGSRRAQRRCARRAQPQDGVPRHHEHRSELR